MRLSAVPAPHFFKPPGCRPGGHCRALLTMDESWDLSYAAGMRGPKRLSPVGTVRVGGRSASVVVISVHRLDQLGRAGISTETLLMVVKADAPIGRSGESA